MITAYPNINLSNPDSQCQFNRSGLLCGQCKPGLNAAFGSSQCKQCLNICFLIIFPLATAGIVLVMILFICNLTVTNGDINAISFYTNVIGINTEIMLPSKIIWICFDFICKSRPGDWDLLLQWNWLCQNMAAICVPYLPHHHSHDTYHSKSLLHKSPEGNCTKGTSSTCYIIFTIVYQSFMNCITCIILLCYYHRI